MGTFADCYFALTNLRIVEKNPRKFKIDQNELQERRAFIDRSKATVRVSCILTFMYTQLTVFYKICVPGISLNVHLQLRFFYRFTNACTEHKFYVNHS